MSRDDQSTLVSNGSLKCLTSMAATIRALMQKYQLPLLRRKAPRGLAFRRFCEIDLDGIAARNHASASASARQTSKILGPSGNTCEATVIRARTDTIGRGVCSLNRASGRGDNGAGDNPDNRQGRREPRRHRAAVRVSCMHFSSSFPSRRRVPRKKEAPRKPLRPMTCDRFRTKRTRFDERRPICSAAGQSGIGAPMTDEPDKNMQRLLELVRAGDRDAAAKFALEFFPELRARVRHRIPKSIRRELDSEDAAASAARRLDEAVATGRMRSVTEETLQAYLASSALHSIQDRARSIRSRSAREQERSQKSEAVVPEVQHGETWTMLNTSTISAEDRELLRLLGAGLGYRAIAAAMGMSEASVRARVSRARRHLEKLVRDDTDTESDD